MNKHNWKWIKFLSGKDDWKKTEKSKKKEKKYPAYVSKNNLNCEKQFILLIIPNGERRWYYFAVKKLSALLREITKDTK